MLKVIKLLPIV